MRLSHLFLFCVMFAIGCAVYNVANHYQTAEKKLSRINRNIEREQENIRVLKAEWAYLTNPVRIEKIARDFLNMQGMTGHELVALNAVPFRAAMDEAEKTTEDTKPHTGSMPYTASAMPTMKALPVNTGGAQ